MVPPAAYAPRSPIGWRGPALLHFRSPWLLFGAVFVGMSVAPIINCLLDAPNKDYPLWYQVGQAVLEGRDIYPRDARVCFPFMYPITAALLLAPLSGLGQVPMILCLEALNSAAWVASILLSVYFATGRPGRGHPLLYLAPSLCCGAYIHSTYLLGQPNLLLLAVMLGAFGCLRHGRDWAGGALIALAAAIKAFPILAVVYLVYRRHWKALGGCLGGLVVFLVLIPAPFRGMERNLTELRIWFQGMGCRYDEGTIGQRPGRSYSWTNQSLLAVANRLLRPVNAWDSSTPRFVNLATLDFRSVNAVVVLVALILGTAYASVMPNPARRTPRGDAVEWAMLLVLVLILSPYAFNYFFVWLLYPLTVAVDWALTAPRGSGERIAVCAWLGTVLLLLGLALPIPGSCVAQAVGNSFWASLLLLLGLGWRLHRLQADALAPSLSIEAIGFPGAGGSLSAAKFGPTRR